MYQEAGFLSTSIGAAREFRLAPQALGPEKSERGNQRECLVRHAIGNIEVQIISVAATRDHTVGQHTKGVEIERILG